MRELTNSKFIKALCKLPLNLQSIQNLINIKTIILNIIILRINFQILIKSNT